MMKQITIELPEEFVRLLKILDRDGNAEAVVEKLAIKAALGVRGRNSKLDGDTKWINCIFSENEYLPRIQKMDIDI